MSPASTPVLEPQGLGSPKPGKRSPHPWLPGTLAGGGLGEVAVLHFLSSQMRRLVRI